MRCSTMPVAWPFLSISPRYGHPICVTAAEVGGIGANRCETVAKSNAKSGMQVQANVKAGGIAVNRCETVSRA